MQPTWILVADGARARLFSPGVDGTSFIELEDFVDPDGRNAIQPHTSPEVKITERFARELSDVLERGRIDHRYERLILAAPPRFLGTLQRALGKQTHACVVAHLDKDLTRLPASEILARLAPQLAT